MHDQIIPWHGWMDPTAKQTYIAAAALSAPFRSVIITMPDALEERFFLYNNKDEGGEVPYDVTRIRVDSSVTSIPSKAFRSRRQLLEIQLPNRLRSIGPLAFYGCKALTKVTIPPLVRAIPNDLFRSCESLQEVELSEGLVEILPDAFCRCISLRIIRIPRTVKRIRQFAFQDCQSLESISLPERLQEISFSSFHGCISLKKIAVPSSVKSIGGTAFRGCSHLVSVELQEGLRMIDSLAFLECVSLTAMRIPSTVSKIGREAFAGCSRLVSVELFERNLQILHGLAFARCSSLGNLALPSSITNTLYENVFQGCSKLQELPLANDRDLLETLTKRFDNRPVHKVCYYQVFYPLDTALRDLRGAIEESDECDSESDAYDESQVDCLGMTPYHILALSTRPDLSLLEACLPRFSKDLWSKQDSTGSSPMEYLCKNIAPETPESIKWSIQLTLGDRIQWLGLEQWRRVVFNATERLLVIDRSERLGLVHSIHSKLELYELKEAVSLLELALWKVKTDEVTLLVEMEEIRHGKQKGLGHVDRQSCRVNCGADIVIANVLPFLGALTSNDSRA
jgi:hypothetical protein